MDVESKVSATEYLEGFSEFSEYIGSDPQLALFRRFDTLAARNLLYLQGQLLEIEYQLQVYDDEDVASITGYHHNYKHARSAARDWASFEKYSQGKDVIDPIRVRMELVLKLRRVMKEYQEALVLHSKGLRLSQPEGHIIGIFRAWLDKKTPFLSSATDCLREARDLASLGPAIDSDLLSRAIQCTFGYFFRVGFIWRHDKIDQAPGARPTTTRSEALPGWSQ